MTEGQNNTCIIRKAIWTVDHKEVKAMLSEKEKGRDIREDNRLRRNYLDRMNLDDARVSFRYRSKMNVRVKANRSSEFRNTTVKITYFINLL